VICFSVDIDPDEEEDEEVLIERRRKQREALLQVGSYHLRLLPRYHR
jgi:hypothetical protein